MEAQFLSLKPRVLHNLTPGCSTSSPATLLHGFPWTLQAHITVHSIHCVCISFIAGLLSSPREKTRSFLSFIFISHCLIQSLAHRKCSFKIHSFIQLVFTENLLCARHCGRPWGCCSEQRPLMFSPQLVFWPGCNSCEQMNISYQAVIREMEENKAV